MLELPDLGSTLPEVVPRTAIVYLFLVAVLTLLGLDYGSRHRRPGRAACAPPSRASRACLSAMCACSNERCARKGSSRSRSGAAMREHGFTDVTDVRLAVLETDGSISVIGRDDMPSS